jgi:hypothetical protein
MTDYTPGPWGAFVEDDEGPAKLPGTFTVDGPDLEWIAQGIKSAADACLIAAAPDLLAALDFLTRAARTEPGMAIYEAHLAEAEAAIARARGEN